MTNYNRNKAWASFVQRDPERAIVKLKQENSGVCFDFARRTAFDLSKTRDDVYIVSFDSGKMYGLHVCTYLKNDNLFVDSSNWKVWYETGRREEVEFNSAYKVVNGTIDTTNVINELPDLKSAKVKFI